MEALTEALSGSFLQAGSLWALRSIPGFPPIIQTIHILGVAMIMGSAVLLSLRILGLAIPSQNQSELIRRVLPWFWLALATNFISGAFFVFGRPDRYFNNPVFTTKMALLIPAVLLILVLFLMERRQVGYWEQAARKWPGRAVALAVLALLLLVATCGRWIAYLEYLQYPLWTMEVYISPDPLPFWESVDNWPLSQIIAATNWFPVLETVHVIAAALVVGTIFWVDLRLLGKAALHYPVTIMNQELVPWTWGAFAVAAVTGLGMFITRASSHLGNPAFQWKLVLLALAGANMAWFHRRVYPQVTAWDTAAALPREAKLSAALSLLFWSGVMLAGRWVGHIV